MEDQERVLKLRNALDQLILSATGRAAQKVERLATKAGIPDPPNNSDIEWSVTKIVFEKARNPKVLLKLLELLPEVCQLERDKDDNRNELIRELKQLFPDLNQKTGDRSSESTDPAGEASMLFNAAIDLVRRTKDLRLKFQTPLSGQELTRVDVTEISGQLAESASNIEELLHAYPIGAKPSIPVRRLLTSLGRIEDEIFRCLDSLWYYMAVYSILEESKRIAADFGVAEADRAAAEMLRLRELNHARSQVRLRLSRVSEECEFFTMQ